MKIKSTWLLGWFKENWRGQVTHSSNDRISLDLLGLDGIYAFLCKPLKRAKYTKQDFSDIGEQVA